MESLDQAAEIIFGRLNMTTEDIFKYVDALLEIYHSNPTSVYEELACFILLCYCQQLLLARLFADG